MGILRIISCKIGAPGNPELAIGSVGEDGKLFFNEDMAVRVGEDETYLETESPIKRKTRKN
jgi:putative phosphoribosyl transferase